MNGYALMADIIHGCYKFVDMHGFH